MKLILMLLMTISFFSVNAYATTITESEKQYRESLSNMSNTTTVEIEELVEFEVQFNQTDSPYNLTSICGQLLERSDVSENGRINCQ